MNLNDKLTLQKTRFLNKHRRKLFKKQVKEITRNLYRVANKTEDVGVGFSTICGESCLPEVIEYFKKQGITYNYDWSPGLVCRDDQFFFKTPSNSEKQLTESEIIKLTEQSKILDVLFLFISILAMIIVFIYQLWLLFVVPLGCLLFNVFKRKSINNKIRIAKQKHDELMEPEWDKVIEEYEKEHNNV